MTPHDPMRSARWVASLLLVAFVVLLIWKGI